MKSLSRGLVLGLLACCGLSTAALGEGWPVWGANAGGTRYSSLDQINADNVSDLEIAWQFRTGHTRDYSEFANQFSAFQNNPILLPEEAGGHLLVCTPFNDVIALDPGTGQERWRFKPEINLGGYGSRRDPDGEKSIPFKKCRGVAYWHDPNTGPAAAACDHRILYGSNDLRLFALDARTGEPCQDFGERGQANVEALYLSRKPAWRNEVQFYSPPAIINDLMVMGSSVRDNHRVRAPRGTVRAYSVRNGQLIWEWDPIPRDPSDPAYAEWDAESVQQTGAGNAWTPMSVDQERDLIFLATGSPSPDFFGASRPGDNRYADSLVVLKGSTGELVWHFQTIHHDVWDYDNAAQPVLVQLQKNGQPFPAVIQATKTGMIYIFHRETGEPYFEIEERPVPGDGVPGEVLSPTQPFPVAPPPLVPQDFSQEDFWWPTARSCRKRFGQARFGPIFTPPSLEGTLVVPATAGGVNWGSVAIHEPSRTLVTNVLNLLQFVQLIPRDQGDDAPGRNDDTSMGFPVTMNGTPYKLLQTPAMSEYSTPCNPPPWAKLVAVDLDHGTIKWESPLGTIDKLAPIPLPIRWGTPTFAGGIVTGGGLVFIGATADNRFRAFDVQTGRELWHWKLPTSSFAHPMTYSIGERQYVVIVSGGHPFVDQDPGDYVTAFALTD